jgi:hypothetical protein
MSTNIRTLLIEGIVSKCPLDLISRKQVSVRWTAWLNLNSKDVGLLAVCRSLKLESWHQFEEKQQRAYKGCMVT